MAFAPLGDDGSSGSATRLGAGVAGSAALVSAAETRAVSGFNGGGGGVTLTQSIGETVGEGTRVGSVVSRTYQISNNSGAAQRFALVRHLDGDLAFDGSTSDGGGVLRDGDTRILFETDATGNGSDADTFVGINATGGAITSGSSFSVRSCCGNLSPADDSVEGDDDGDGFVDSPSDVTLILQNSFDLAANGSAIDPTRTLFGRGVPDTTVVTVDGTSEADPLRPTLIADDGAFLFEIGQDLFDAFDVDREDFLVDPTLVTPTIFIDPEIAVGYTHTVTGADFANVTAPSFEAVPDPDGYTVRVDGMTFDIEPGERIEFADLGPSGVTFFEILGIGESLMLDPDNTMASITGMGFTNLQTPNVRATQDPIVRNVDDPTVIPLPAGIVLLAARLAGSA